MKREKTAALTMTNDEYRDLLMKIREKESETEKRLTISDYLREYVLKPHLNGQCSPSEETPQETPKEEPKMEDKFGDINF